MPLRITTAHRFWPVLERYSRLVTRRVLIQAKLRSRQRNISVLYRGAAFPLGRLAEMDEVRTLLDPAQMHTRDLFEARVLRQQLDACLSETSANSYRLGRILTLELAVQAANSARKELRGSGVVSMAS